MKKQIQTITEEEARLLLSGLVYLSNTPTSVRRSVRNTCIVLVMLDAGLRVGEAVQLTKADLHSVNGPNVSVIVRAFVAKTHVERIVPMTDRLKRSIENMQRYVWGDDSVEYSDPAFYISHGVRRISVDQVQIFIKQACILAHIRHINPHVLRHTFATRVMKQTNTRVVQQLLGHSSLSSTQVYTHPDQEDRKKAIEQMESSTNDKNQSASKTSTPNLAATKEPS